MQDGNTYLQDERIPPSSRHNRGLPGMAAQPTAPCGGDTNMKNIYRAGAPVMMAQQLQRPQRTWYHSDMRPRIGNKQR